MYYGFKSKTLKIKKPILKPIYTFNKFKFKKAIYKL